MNPSSNYSVNGLERLTHFSVLSIDGPDAETFIHSQSMNDVKALAVGQWHWNGLLNPKGRLIALFALVKMREDLVFLISPDFPAEKLRTHLQRFVFRSKVKLSINEEFQAYASFMPTIGGDDSQIRDFVLPIEAPGFGLCMSGDHDHRYVWFTPKSQTPEDTVESLADSKWRDLDLQYGLPRLKDEQSEAWTPQMLSLERLKAFSVKKGCYPGQEIVARTHFLGQSKRCLIGVRNTDNALEIAQPVHHSSQVLGHIICISEDKTTGLAVISLPSNELEHAEMRANPMFFSLANGLQRPI